MASKKEVTVVINGEEFVSKAADSASGAMGGFASKIPTWAAAGAALAVAFKAVSAAVGGVKDFVADSFAAFDTYAASQNKMAAQSKLTGVSMAELNATAKTARDEFGLGAVVANDAATTVAKYATRAGDASKKNELLAAALNLGAASGLDAAASMQALEMGLRGQDEGFDKLLGKNPSTIWKEYADANGLAVGKMTDTQKRMAELTAVVEAGNVVGDTYTERMKSAAGQQELLNNKMENAKVAFGAALQPVRTLVIQGLVKLVEVATPVVMWLGRMANSAGIILGGAFQDLRGATGAVAEAFGKLTGNESLQAWGKAQQTAADAAKKSIEAMGKATTDAGTAHQAAATQHEQAAVKTSTATVKAGEVSAAEMEKINRIAAEKLGPGLAQLIGVTETAIGDLGKAARDQLPIDKANEFDGHMQSVAEQAKLIGERITATNDPASKNAGHARDMAKDVGTVARGALDAAQAFGIIDAKSASALNSVITIADSIANIIGATSKEGIAGGIAALVGSIANVAVQILSGDAARRRLIAENNVELERLRNEIGNLSLNVTGEDFANAKDALGSVIGQLRGGRGAANQTDVVNALRARGLSLSDLDKIANELGIKIKSESGALSVDGLKQLFEAMGLVELGQFGEDYTSQKQATTAGFGVNQTDDAGQIAALAKLGEQFSPVLRGLFDGNDLASTRQRLASLFARLNDGGVSARELGGLSGSQFLDLLTDLIGRIDNLKPTGGSDDPPADVPAANRIGALSSSVALPGVGSVSTGGVSDTMQAVLQSQANATLNVLTLHSHYQSRIADATERSAGLLEEIRDALSSSDTGIRAIDTELETRRRMNALDLGRMPVLR